MASERRWAPIPTQLLTANGAANGQLQIADAWLLKAKQIILVTSNTQATQRVEVKQVISKTIFQVGRPDEGMDDRLDMSGFLISDSGSISSPDAFQSRPKMSSDEVIRAAYEEEPVCGSRVFIVGHGGQALGSDPAYPFYVRLSDGSINIGTISAQLETFLTHKDNDPDAGDVHSSLRIGDGVTEVVVTLAGEMRVTDADAHSGLSQVDSDLVAFKSESHSDAIAIEGKLDAVSSELGQIDVDLNAFKNANHSDLVVLHADNVVVEGKLDTHTASLQLIDNLPHNQNDVFSEGVPVMGQLDDAGTTAATEDRVAVARITPQRAVHTNLRNQAGTEIGTASNPVRTDPTGTSAQPVFISIPSTASASIRHGSVTLSALGDIIKTTYTEQTVNAQRSVVSSNANDTSAGTGVRTLRITYYDSTLAGPYTEDLILNGTTPVNTVGTNICFIESIKALTVGSGNVAIGTISLKAATAGGGVTVWSIAVGDIQTYAAHHYVGSAVSAYISKITGATAGGIIISVQIKKPTVANSVTDIVTDFRVNTQFGTIQREFNPAYKVIGPARILLRATPDTNSTVLWGDIEFYDQ